MVKIYILFVLSNLYFFQSYGQLNRAIYKQLVKEYDESKISNLGLDENQKQLLQAFMKIQSETQFELVFDKNESIYSKVETLELDEGNQLQKMKNINNDIFYNNIPSKEKIFNTSQFIQKYNVILDYKTYVWQITNETKVVSGFKCFKALTTVLDSYNPLKDRQLQLTHYAWFTPDLPYSFGPKGFDGLPGLVLEASENGRIFYVTSIEFDLKNAKPIEKPKASTTISSEEYDKMITANLQRIKDEMGN